MLGFFDILTYSRIISLILLTIGAFLHVLSFDEHQKSTKQNSGKSSTSVSSVKCFISADRTLDDSNRLQRAKNLPQGTQPILLFPIIFLPNRKFEPNRSIIEVIVES